MSTNGLDTTATTLYNSLRSLQVGIKECAHRTNPDRLCHLLSDYCSFLTSLEALAGNDEKSQHDLGSHDGILIKTLIESICDPDFASVLQENKFSITCKHLWIVCKLCRRTMEKTTASQSNIAIVQNYIENIIELMNQCLESPEVAYVLCRIVMILASDSSDRQFLLAKLGATNSVVHVMDRHPSDPLVAEFSFRATRNLSIDDDITAKLVEDGVCSALNGAILAHIGSQNAEVCEAFLWTTVNLSCDDRVATLLGAAGICENVITVTKFMLHIESAVEAACCAIRNLSSAGSYNYTRFSECGACDVLVDAIRAHSSSLDVVEAGMFALANLALDKEMAHRLCAVGAPELIIRCQRDLKAQTSALEAPRSYLSFGPIAESGLFALRNLASASVENQTAVCSTSGVAATVVELMEMYSDRSGMVELALSTVTMLINENEANKALARDQTPIFEIAFAGMRAHGEKSSDMTEAWLRFVAVAGRDDEANRTILLGMDALRIAAKSIFVHRGDPEVFRLCCEVLLSLHYFTPELRAGLVAQPGILDESGTRAMPPSKSVREMVAAWGIDQFYSEPDSMFHTSIGGENVAVEVGGIESLLGGGGGEGGDGRDVSPGGGDGTGDAAGASEEPEEANPALAAFITQLLRQQDAQQEQQEKERSDGDV